MAKSLFLSSNAQDFIEENPSPAQSHNRRKFLSSNAQDFIEENPSPAQSHNRRKFLSSNAQDFIEDCNGSPVQSSPDDS